ncbi:hypothetical protein [Agreia sp. COWG]|uniref:hypothetical protein n=1 Tax=Agreia sp. COWG TaxID=2773266 RepID=UPI0019262E36|nr:hypothetical protein [Agreia sp. COWG]CAD5991169.1 conserved protein of unknown function [Agreia sp. COWG]
MKRITYAGESVLTSDTVATVLVELTAALAKKGLAEAVRIPICDATGTDVRTAELVIGIGNDVLAVPESGVGADPDFSTEESALRGQLENLTSVTRARLSSSDSSDSSAVDEFDFELGLPAVDESGDTPPAAQA